MATFDQSLLERIEAASGARQTSRAGFDSSAHMRSILSNIRRVLNERWGSCETRLDYGLPDINEVLNGGGTPAQFGAAIQTAIQQFEPRLSAVTVRFVPDADHPMRVNFRIAAMMQCGDANERVAFDTVLSEDKRIRVRG